jgi:hypothetical protein
LNDPVPDTLQESTAAGLLDTVAFLFGLAQRNLENEVKRRRNDREDDGPATKSPSPANLVVELICNLGTGERGDDVGGRGEGKCKTSVLELRGVGGDDIDTVLHTTEADVVEDLTRDVSAIAKIAMSRRHSWNTYIGGTVDGKAVASGQQDQTKSSEAGHHEETLSTAPGIHHLSDGDVDRRRESIGHSRGNTGQGVSSERTGDVRAQAGEHGRLEGVDEV